MILECSQCRTRYLVPDSAVGPDGRTVRCAACKHSWFQPGHVLDLVARAEAPLAPAPSPPPPPPPPPPDVVIAPPGTAPDYDAFANEPPFRPRRNPARRWTMAAIAAGILMLIGAGAILWSGAPGLADRFGLQLGPAEVPLKIVSNAVDHRDLDNGSHIFAVSGKVVNPTSTRQHVPDIRVELKDAQNRVVYGWMIRPDATTLAPHGSVEFNSAKLDVPLSSKNLVLSFSGEAAS
ncbi:zinc-ribbon domain-containing protein [Sphingomonas oligophenolica]|uniref:MJ0042-type zinc finger domain-containing protein n=1 Tax=Sphingomonas oligophenolica TaxID=301154 RepID=A0ABU9Y2L8_9SPHN